MMRVGLERTRTRLQALANTLSFRLFLSLFGIVLAVVAGFAYVNIHTTSERWMQFVYESASRMSDLIKRSTHYGMMQNRKEDVHQIIRTIAQTSGVVGVRIFDKQGIIIFSADAAEIGQRVDRQAEACIICHDQETPMHSAPTESRMRVYRAANGQRILGLINPIENGPGCSNGACHAHPRNQTVLGVLDVKMSMEPADEALRDMTSRTIVATLAKALIIGIASALFIYRTVRMPVRRLTEVTQRIARGDLETRIDICTKDEIGQLAASFNQMTDDLRRARQEITEWSEKLEQKVIAKTDELTRVQKQILHMEKMASLGKLAATMAHELNNPLSGILIYAKLVGRELDAGQFPSEQREELGRYLSLIQRESSRCGEIVRNLRVFSRQSGGEFVPHHLNILLERALLLVRHHLEMSNIRLETLPIDGDDQIVCDANQVEQALVALFVNAVEAMPGGGTLAVRLCRAEDSVHVELSDSGVGIDPEVLPHIFEPFFSTKEGESGVGLGLAVVYGIVHRHGGVIEVSSEPGSGTTFRIKLPAQPPPEAISEEARPEPASSHGGGR
jgi:two-component system, NtrC family, sensor kinase